MDKKKTEAWVSESTDSESETERTANLTNGVEEAYDPSAKYETSEKVVDTSKQLQEKREEPGPIWRCQFLPVSISIYQCHLLLYPRDSYYKLSGYKN